MPLLNSGRDYQAGVLTGHETTLLDHTNAYLCVGDSTIAFAVTQTDLQATTNKLRQAMDATYPQRTGNVLTFRSTFGASKANFAWNEWGIANAAAGGVLYNRLVEYNGTKLSGQTWIFEVDLTIAIGS